MERANVVLPVRMTENKKLTQYEQGFNDAIDATIILNGHSPSFDQLYESFKTSAGGYVTLEQEELFDWLRTRAKRRDGLGE